MIVDDISVNTIGILILFHFRSVTNSNATLSILSFNFMMEVVSVSHMAGKVVYVETILGSIFNICFYFF